MQGAGRVQGAGAQGGSNRRPPACEADVIATRPQVLCRKGAPFAARSAGDRSRTVSAFALLQGYPAPEKNSVKGSKHLGTRQRPDVCLHVSGSKPPASSMQDGNLCRQTGPPPPAAGHRRLRPSPPSQTRGQVASQVSAPLDSFTPRHAQQPEARAVSGRSAFGQNARETVQQTGNDSRGKRVKGSKHLGTRQQPDACLRVSGTRQPASSMERSSESPRLLSIIGPVCGAEMFDFLQ